MIEILLYVVFVYLTYWQGEELWFITSFGHKNHAHALLRKCHQQGRSIAEINVPMDTGESGVVAFSKDSKANSIASTQNHWSQNRRTMEQGWCHFGWEDRIGGASIALHQFKTTFAPFFPIGQPPNPRWRNTTSNNSLINTCFVFFIFLLLCYSLIGTIPRIEIVFILGL